MKRVILSADNDRKVYAVPDRVADDLEEYCLEFCTRWLRTSPHARQYRAYGGLCYDERDFIDYLNRWVFPEEPSVFVANLGRDQAGPAGSPRRPDADYPEFRF